jgi:hypothetical protein
VLSPIKRGTSGKYQITTHKDRGGFHKRGKLATFELTSDPETHHFTWAFVAAPVADEEHPFRPTGLMERVSRFLERQPEPVSRKEVEEDRSARLVALIRAYREASDDFAPTSPHFAPKSEESTSPLRPTPYGGGEVRGDLAERGEVTSPSLLEDNDGIPF